MVTSDSMPQSMSKSRVIALFERHIAGYDETYELMSQCNERSIYSAFYDIAIKVMRRTASVMSRRIIYDQVLL